MLSLFLHMRKILAFNINSVEDFRRKCIEFARQFDTFILLDSHSDKLEKVSKYAEFDMIAAAGQVCSTSLNYCNFSELRNFTNSINDWRFGHFSFNLQTETEGIISENENLIGFPDLFFFQPKWFFILKGNQAELQYLPNITEYEAITLVEKFNNPTNQAFQHINKEIIECRTNEKDYLNIVNQLKWHISRGDIYEVNFCIEFFSKNYNLDPYKTYLLLSSHSPAPFASFYKLNDKFLICSSPERYLRKLGSTIISQPIKGTAARGFNPDEDKIIVNNLVHSKKERAENIMITDLVRNDLSKTAVSGSVKVDELCSIYSFKHVHQMISTVSAKLDEKQHFTNAIKNSFPMGSMTGAPKHSALKIVNQFESFNRGLFSGSVGYIAPSNDFDFNVVIRSILYNSTNKYLSIPAGSAITSYCEPEKEYEECLLKAKALLEVLKVV